MEKCKLQYVQLREKFSNIIYFSNGKVIKYYIFKDINFFISSLFLGYNFKSQKMVYVQRYVLQNVFNINNWNYIIYLIIGNLEVNCFINNL